MARVTAAVAAVLGLLARCVQAADAIPFKRDEAGAGTAAGGAALGLLLVSALAIAAVWLVRKRLKLQPQGGTQLRLLRVLESQRLGPRAVLSVVEFAGGRYLIAQSEQGVSCLVAAPDQSPASHAVTERLP